MKRIISLIVFILMLFCMACSSKNVLESISSQDTNIPASITVEQQAFELFSKVAEDYKAYGKGAKLDYKKLEDIYFENQDNQTIANLYWFCLANDYIRSGNIMETDESQNIKEIAAKIDPKYSGEYAEMITGFAKEILGNDYDNIRSIAVSSQEKYDAMSIVDKAQVIKYIYDQYDYYDAIDGKNTGDKYSETIWKDAAAKFGISNYHIDLIWANSEATTYYSTYLKNNSSENYDQPKNTKNPVTTYDAKLVYGNGSVIVAISEDALDSFFNALANNNDAAITELLNEGLIGETPKGSKVAIIKTGILKYQVRLLDGPYEGNTVWVISECVQKD